MLYATKTALVILDDLLPWQKVNIAAFLAGGLAARHEIIGEPYRDGDGNAYAALIREPVFIYGADAAGLKRTHGRALSRSLEIAIYIREMFATSHDAANREAVAALPADALDFVGIGLHGERKIIDKVTSGLKFMG
ncbi:hypothetical protein SAMN02745157_4784 [Kaistia soli DSM 19436]|uniref:DUF2000 domain-containing protein n=1 Tax=Kaistia soli DSM 19436 TaxID=1122133 RepID=A0A1M5MGW0_9HYPH|nr:DUF2000 family protein [Kaistia soli]SHG76550.1 hypothetical protein SAMN02745157_4784 [Kaistia soli DSM 19436]